MSIEQTNSVQTFKPEIATLLNPCKGHSIENVHQHSAAAAVFILIILFIISDCMFTRELTSQTPEEATVSNTTLAAMSSSIDQMELLSLQPTEWTDIPQIRYRNLVRILNLDLFIFRNVSTEFFIQPEVVCP